MGAAQRTAALHAPEERRGADLGPMFRAGHPGIAAGDAVIAAWVVAFARAAQRPIEVLETGCASGELLVRLDDELRSQGLPARLVGLETDAATRGIARAKLAGRDVEVVAGSLATWSEPADVIVSWGSFHHAPPTDLERAADLLAPGGLLVLGDEFCPEFLTPAEAEVLAAAPILQIEDGWIFSDPADLDAYLAHRELPAATRALELRRQRALSRWYAHVVDHALARALPLVAVSELEAAAADLDTANAAERKLPCSIAESLFARAGLEVAGRVALGERPGEAPAGDVALRSFHVYRLVR